MPLVIESQEKSKKRHSDEIEIRLDKLKSKSEEEHAARFAEELGLPYLDLHIIPLNVDDLYKLKEEVSRKARAAIIHSSGKRVKIATSNPSTENFLEFIYNMEENLGWKVSVVIVSPSSLEHALSQYENVFLLETLDAIKINLSGSDLEKFEQGLGRLLKLNNSINTLPTTEILDIIFAGAVSLGASDIHFEPEREEVRLRYRTDGVLRDVIHISFRIYKLIVSRIKLMGKMRINVRDKAQDGHFSFTVNEVDMDVRVSIIPGKKEGIVMRLLDSRGINVSIYDLGLEGKAFDDVSKSIQKNTGMILTTGPTGSGKTTTLYTIINHIKSEEVKIITIEDPIEYQLDGIVQTEISKNKNFTFAKGLRAIVRQDPDIILVGEIRDDETADIAVNAALTGHLVFSTLHTNNAIATIARLTELGIRPTLISPATNIFMAQRLVRKLCSCKESYVPAQETKDSIMRMIGLISPKAKMNIPTEIELLYRPKGCDLCHGTGYKGRIGIFEVFSISPEIEELILNMAGETEMMKTAFEEGFVTMTQDGVIKSLNGITSLDEIWRVTSEGDIIGELYDKLTSQLLSSNIFINLENQNIAIENSENKNSILDRIKNIDNNNLLQLIFSYGLLLRSSDVHIEPQQNEVLIRMRIDGVLQTIATIPLKRYPILISKIKDLSNIQTMIRQGVSDSRFSITQEIEGEKNNRMDIRVSIILGGFGETVVMRILNRKNTALDITKLDFREYNMHRIIKEIEKPYGMILNTGPTGSGKTTTLYSILNKLNKPSVKIITVEDPIEYQLNGILQTQINKEEGYTFAKALRALLRQDPDILLIGEIRDNETASIAVDASLTGHLLLSTLHTNNAVGAIQRLINLGVRTDDIITSVNAFIAQRLVRKLCSCKEKIKPSKEEQELLDRVLKSISKKVDIDVQLVDMLYKANGCSKCNGIGFKGRSVISEVFVMNDVIRRLISQGAMLSEILESAIESGMLTMEQDAALKVVQGTTTLEEVQRVTML